MIDAFLIPRAHEVALWLNRVQRAILNRVRFVALDATAQAAVNIDRPGDAFGRSAIIAETSIAETRAFSSLARFVALDATAQAAVNIDRPGPECVVLILFCYNKMIHRFISSAGNRSV